MIVMGIQQGMQPIVGYNYGAQLYHRMLRAFKLAVYCATCVMSFLFLFGEIWPEGFIRLFTHDELLIAQSITPARIMLAVMFAIGFPMITGNFYTSIGMAPKAIFLSLTRQVLFLIPLIIGLPLLFKSLGIAPIWGVWWSLPLCDALAAILSAIIINRDMKKFTVDPTPIEVEMSLYENDMFFFDEHDPKRVFAPVIVTRLYSSPIIKA